ncbi:MAG: DUF2520 domain-containing protein [Candidatus Dormibacteraeota bacterium]|nr:DUF2520 domain-containing protein [Candidatus Dormibacteraeota bacterium]
MNRDSAAGTPPTLSFIGAGRAASALAVAAQGAGYDVVAINGRNAERARALAQAVGARVVSSPFAAVNAACLTVVAVPDAAVRGVAATLAANGAALAGRGLVHTAAMLGSGALAAARLTGVAVGVLHPLQALAGVDSADLLPGSYFRLEGEGVLRAQLEALVAALGAQVLDVPAEARVAYHAAAVLAGNAPLALLARARSVLEAAGVDGAEAQAALAVLLHGAATNALRSGAREALTGPVARGDAVAVAAHLEVLGSDPSALELYATLARETAELAGRDPADLGLEQRERDGSHVRRVA